MRGSLTHPLVEEHHAADGEPSLDRLPRGGCDPAVRELGLGRAAFGWNRHCEERSDEAIQRTCAPCVPLDCFPRVPKPRGRNDDRGSIQMQLELTFWRSRCLPCALLCRTERKPTKRAPGGALLIAKRQSLVT